MNQEQKDRIIKSLKTAKSLGCGQPIWVLSNVGNAYTEQVSNFLQSLKRRGKVSYFSTTKVWHWKDHIDCNELIDN